jgi:hypothetical protein
MRTTTRTCDEAAAAVVVVVVVLAAAVVVGGAAAADPVAMRGEGAMPSTPPPPWSGRARTAAPPAPRLLLRGVDGSEPRGRCGGGGGVSRPAAGLSVLPNPRMGVACCGVRRPAVGGGRDSDGGVRLLAAAAAAGEASAPAAAALRSPALLPMLLVRRILYQGWGGWPVGVVVVYRSRAAGGLKGCVARGRGARERDVGGFV